MKIVCDACQAKYSISDDKVQGKVFKIRCKKCSNIIVVRGGAGAVEAPAQPQVEKETRVYDYGYEGGEAPAGDDAVWHVVINQDQVGPMTAAEVHQRFGAGEIDAETYIWREGFADWLPIAQVDTFAQLASAPAAGGGGLAAPAGGGHDAVSSMFGGGGGEEAGTTRSDPGDLFAASSAGSRGDDDEGDLFGGGRSAPAAQAAASGAAASSKMRGERNENSVLFSLNNLAQLASDKPAPAASSSGGGQAPGHAGGEGSGLIDIRSMASAYLGGGAGMSAKPVAASSIGSIDDLPVFSGAGFSEPAVIMPTSRPANNNKLMYMLLASVGALAIVAVVLIVVMMRGGKSAPAVAAGGSGSSAAVPATDTGSAAVATGPAGTTTGSAATDPGSGAAGSAAVVAAGSGSATQVAVVDKPPATDKPVTDKPLVADKHPTTTPPKKTPVAEKHDTTPPKGHDQVALATKPDKTPKPDKPDKPAKPDKADPGAGGGGCDEVSCVLNGNADACCQKYKRGGGSKPKDSGTASKPAGGGDLPDGLDRTMISDGVGKVKARVMACGDKSPAKGQVKVSVKVGADGKVVSVTVKTTPDPTLGGCVSAAMQRATFAKTQNGGSFGYPFVF